MSPAHADFDAEGRDRAMLDADRLPRRAPPEPSAAAIEAAAKTEIGECIYREWQRARKDGMQGQERDFAFAVVRSMLRAAYAVDAPRGLPVTAPRAPSEALRRSRIEHWLRNRHLAFGDVSTNKQFGYGNTVDAVMALLNDLGEDEYLAAAAPAPPEPT